MARRTKQTYKDFSANIIDFQIEIEYMTTDKPP